MSSGGEHLQEVREAAGGLREFIGTMKNALSSGELSAVERAAYGRLLGQASRALDRVEDALRIAK
jgi:hypothetical protein